MANKGLPVSSVVSVDVVMAPKAAAERDFGIDSRGKQYD